jgi:hypothetical protein
MPALFAYLVAVGLLLGGGYGALSWLAAPEPVKVAKAKPRSHYRASPKANAPETSPLAIGDHEEVAATSNAQPSSPASEASPVSEAGVAAREQGAKTEGFGPASDKKTRSGHVEALSDEAEQTADASLVEVKQSNKQPAQAALQGSSGNAQSAEPAALTPVAKIAAPPRPRRANTRSRKGALALMTLRTIEYPDGRSVTRLIPYRGGERALALQLDE